MKDLRSRLSTISKDKGLTGFEKDVYRAVTRIPRGEVRTYAWVAGRIGKPRAVRAVGNALNKNPYLDIVPCHRVVRSDGTIGGYARGSRVKERILKSEGLDVRQGRLL